MIKCIAGVISSKKDNKGGNLIDIPPCPISKLTNSEDIYFETFNKIEWFMNIYQSVRQHESLMKKNKSTIMISDLHLSNHDDKKQEHVNLFIDYLRTVFPIMIYHGKGLIRIIDSRKIIGKCKTRFSVNNFMTLISQENQKDIVKYYVPRIELRHVSPQHSPHDPSYIIDMIYDVQNDTIIIRCT